ncbi:MAG: PaaI family thioesterase [Pseudomonadota bacterium]
MPADTPVDTTAGTLDPAAIAPLDGLTQLRMMMDGRFPPPAMALTLGFAMTRAEVGEVWFEGTPTEAHLNPLGTIHAGWTMAVLDSACACAVHSTLKPGEIYTTLELKTNLVRALRPGQSAVTAHGVVIHRGGRIATAEARMTTADGKVCAHATTTCMIMRAG